MKPFYFVIFWVALQLFGFGKACSQTVTREKLREYFLTALEHKGARDSIIQKLEKIKHKTPCEESYTGICYAFRTYNCTSTWSKLPYVFKARTHLNNAVERAPKDPEFRFLRFVLEHYLPPFLGLNKHMSEDLQFVFSHLNFIDDNPRVKKKVFEFILKSKRASTAQNKQIEEILKNIKL
jgi:hypothetical protein